MNERTRPQNAEVYTKTEQNAHTYTYASICVSADVPGAAAKGGGGWQCRICNCQRDSPIWTWSLLPGWTKANNDAASQRKKYKMHNCQWDFVCLLLKLEKGRTHKKSKK